MVRNIYNAFSQYNQEISIMTSCFRITSYRCLHIISTQKSECDGSGNQYSHNYPTITKNCCRDWLPKLSYLAALCSKLCNKLPIQFKHLNSVIQSITDHQVSCLVNRQATRFIELPTPFLSFQNLYWNFPSLSNTLIQCSLLTVSDTTYKIFVILDTVDGKGKRAIPANFMHKAGRFEKRSELVCYLILQQKYFRSS